MGSRTPGNLFLKNLPKVIKLAYRNLFRNKRRTLFIVFIAASGAIAMSIAVGYYAFSIDSLKEMTIRNGFSGSGGATHIQIINSKVTGIQEQQSLEFGIENASPIIEAILSSPYVDYVMPRVAYGGLISNGEKSFPFMGYGIQADEEAKLIEGISKVDPKFKGIGNNIKPLAKKPRGVILGQSLAKSLGAKIGDVLLMYGTTVNGAVNAVDVELINIVSTGVNETDKYYLLVAANTAQELVLSTKVSSICVMFKDRSDFEKKVGGIANILSEKFPDEDLRIVDWEDYGEFYRSVRDIFNIIFTFMGSIVIVIVLLSCWNIMNMTTMERIREIGTLRAIGLKTNSIGSVFLFESFLIGVVGVILGLITQYGITFVINSSNIPMPPIPGMNQGYSLKVYSFTPFQPVISIGIILVITLSSLSSFFVIRRYSIVKSLEHS